MNVAYRFVGIALVVLLLPSVLSAAPLHPRTEAALRASGQFDRAKGIYFEARSRGLDHPTPYPINPRILRDSDRTELQVLTILVDFSDNQADTAQYPIEHYEELLYSVGTFPTGSLRDYYLENSYGEVHIVGQVVGWYRMPQTYAYYVNNQYGFGSYPHNAQRLTEDAVAAADPDVDFSLYDNDGDGYVDALFVVHAGPGAEQTGSTSHIWSHAWVTHNVPYVDGVYVYSYSQEPEDGHIGVFGHELGHALFGLPDLYDYDYDSHGTGFWSMMSVGVWGGGGVTPVHFDAWSKVQAGFASAVNILSDQTDVVIPQVETAGVIYRLWTEGVSGPQYFLVENRQLVGFDVSIPAAGLLIYHIEEQYGSNNNQWYPGYTAYGHYLVAVEQADGDWDLEQYVNAGDGGDPWPGSAGATAFDDFSMPDSRDYNFCETDVAVRNISASADTMYADFEVGMFIPTGLEVTLTPESPSIIIPDAGGSFSYDAEVINHDSTVAQTQFWVMVQLPNGSWFGPLVGPVNLNLPGNSSLEGTLTQVVPGRAPAGDYSLVGYIGSYPSSIEDSSSFYFSKGNATGTGNSDPGADGWSSSGGFGTDEASRPEEFALLDIFPNPFNPVTTIRFGLPEASHVTLTVYDLQGRAVAELVNGLRDEGLHEVSWDASDLASGLYFCRIEAGRFSSVLKMMLVK